MFNNIAPNAVICLSSCPPPTNFIISSMTTSQVTISLEGYGLNKFILLVMEPIVYHIQNQVQK